MQGHGRIIAPDFCVAHREANSGLSTLNRTKSILSIYHQQRQLQKQRGMCLNDTYPFCQQPLSGNCHSICFSKPVLWTATSGWCSFCIQRFEQGMSEAKKRPSGAFSARLHRRGITIDATCPVPSIVPLPRKRLTFSATGSVSPLSVSRCGNTASESLLLRQIKPPSFDGGFIFYSALSANWAFLPLLPQHLSCGEDGVANALRAGTEDLAGLHAL